MNDWELDLDGTPMCFWWEEDYGEYCMVVATYRVRPRGSTTWYAQVCDMHLETAKAMYSDPEIDKGNWEILN